MKEYKTPQEITIVPIGGADHVTKMGVSMQGKDPGDPELHYFAVGDSVILEGTFDDFGKVIEGLVKTHGQLRRQQLAKELERKAERNTTGELDLRDLTDEQRTELNRMVDEGRQRATLDTYVDNTDIPSVVDVRSHSFNDSNSMGL